MVVVMLVVVVGGRPVDAVAVVSVVVAVRGVLQLRRGLWRVLLAVS
jgi:hypothetical protein